MSFMYPFRLLLIERYLLREFLGAFAATLVVLMLVSFGGIVVDLLGQVTRGKMPASLLASQLGLRVVTFAPLILPLALFLGLLIGIGRLYRDSEMAVLFSVGLGPRRLLRPVALLAVPVVAVIALSSLWAGPQAERRSQAMIAEANRSLLVAGLEAGRFIELPGGTVVYVGDLSTDGTRFGRMFLHSDDADGVVNVITARTGELFFDGDLERFIRLDDGFRVEGKPGSSEFRLMRFERNEIQAPDRAETLEPDDVRLKRTTVLLGERAPESRAELHWRLGAPLLAALLAIAAIPLARTEPRQPRYGQLMLALLGYLLYTNLMLIGRAWLGEGVTPVWAGMWWVHLPALALITWLLLRDGQLRRPRAVAA
jgi:lipopolysaccharide export system permease protein